MSDHAELVVPGRFCGPPRSGNGGYTAGALAALLPVGDEPGVVRVRLMQPPPLDASMAVVEQDGTWVASFGGAVVAQATPVEAELTEIDPVDPAAAQAAEAAYPGLTSHPFPTCVVCGTGREPGDGLRIFPGVVGVAEGGVPHVAATWTPHPSLAEPTLDADGAPHVSVAVTWAAMDCIGGWAGDLDERLMVLGEMTARVDALPIIGEEHVVVGRSSGSEGRRTFSSVTLYDADGRVVGTAEQTWIAVDPAMFG